MRKAVIALGSNLGNRAVFLQSALEMISQNIGQITRKSSIIETESWGFESYPFLNQIIVVETQLSPMQLLDSLQKIEKSLFRTEKSSLDENGNPVYHARTIDLDIIDYDGVVLHNSRLTLPHPHIYDRDFNVKLLNELKITI